MTTLTDERHDGAPVVPLGMPLVGGSHERAHGRGTSGLAEAQTDDRSARLAAVRAGELGSVHSWELVTAVDGPGTRLTTFLSGCPLRCLYCHNPDTMEMRRGTDVTADEILGRVQRYRGVMAATGGGLTISGGEPLMQPAFVRRLLRGAKAMGVHTAIDTSGFLGAHCTDEMLDDIDLVLLDVKSGDPETYRRVTGRPLAPTLDFGRRLAARGGTEIWVRFVLVPGLTDDEENVEKVAAYVASLGPAVTRVEVLPFHQMGRDKWAELGMRYELEDTQPPSVELTERVREQFRSHGLTVY
ncbi:pyruvate formate-lyase-activating protein [Cellulomonas massiliensis]|uniref:pyruvate formate-lyase-activating protein n=1 Tax=Cellulomonas massiliensis TaxID=1465811 RepID=UPI000318AFC7|nr:pyruvate formate-lyase-activating protein [Cellulomonas massiliensis]